MDWIVSDFLAIRQGSLGRVRYILKNGLKYLPLYGFYFAQVTIFIYNVALFTLCTVPDSCIGHVQFLSHQPISKQNKVAAKEIFKELPNKVVNNELIAMDNLPTL